MARSLSRIASGSLHAPAIVSCNENSKGIRDYIREQIVVKNY